MTRLDSGQQRRVLELVESLPAGAFDASIRRLEQSLRLTLATTKADLVLWRRTSIARRFGHATSVPPEVVSAMPPLVKLAYVAALTRSLAAAYGVRGDAPGQSWVDEDAAHSVAGLVHGLNDIMWMPVLEERGT